MLEEKLTPISDDKPFVLTVHANAGLHCLAAFNRLAGIDVLCIATVVPENRRNFLCTRHEGLGEFRRTER